MKYKWIVESKFAFEISLAYFYLQNHQLMSGIAIIGIITLGIFLLVIEVFLLPGTTVAGVIGTIIMIVGVSLSYANLGIAAGNLSLFISLIISILLFVIGYKTLNSKGVALDKELTGKMNTLDDDFDLVISDTGMAYGDVKPTGKAIFKHKIYNVRTNGEFIPDNAKIEIIGIHRNQITVKQV
ncbi:MAG: hypothetical protein R3E32_07340 [Chitinophagales bacterium]